MPLHLRRARRIAILALFTSCAAVAPSVTRDIMEGVVLDWTHIVVAVISVVTVAMATHWATKRRERLGAKRALLQRISGGRARILGLAANDSVEAYEALNEVYVAYADAPAVLKAVCQLHEQRRQPERLPDNLVTLIKAMSKSAQIDLSSLNDSFILHPFTPESLPARDRQPSDAAPQHPSNGSRPRQSRADARPDRMSRRGS